MMQLLRIAREDEVLKVTEPDGYKVRSLAGFKMKYASHH